jgi:hypothetical protein
VNFWANAGTANITSDPANSNHRFRMEFRLRRG